MRKTIRKVTMVVPVLMTSCQVSLKWKMGPVAAHSTIMATAITNAVGWPAVRAVHFAKCENFVVRYIIVVPPVCRRCFVHNKLATPSTQPRDARPETTRAASAALGSILPNTGGENGG